jgi:hypothetical protein
MNKYCNTCYAVKRDFCLCEKDSGGIEMNMSDRLLVMKNVLKFHYESAVEMLNDSRAEKDHVKAMFLDGQIHAYETAIRLIIKNEKELDELKSEVRI